MGIRPHCEQSEVADKNSRCAAATAPGVASRLILLGALVSEAVFVENADGSIALRRLPRPRLNAGQLGLGFAGARALARPGFRL